MDGACALLQCKHASPLGGILGVDVIHHIVATGANPKFAGESRKDYSPGVSFL